MNTGYQILDAERMPPLIAELDHVRTLLGGRPEDWRVREVGDGNLNLVFLVDGPAGPSASSRRCPTCASRVRDGPCRRNALISRMPIFVAVAPHVGKLIPAIHHYDPDLHFTIMERLSPHIILRQGLIAGRRYPNVARDIGEYIARACFFTSDLAVPFERKIDGVALFAGNKPLIRITVDLIFAEPYFTADRNRHTSPQLDEAAARAAARRRRSRSAPRASARSFSPKPRRSFTATCIPAR